MNIRAGGTFIVESGGEPSSEELAAVVLALSMIMSEKPPSYASWRQAALREALGAAVAQCAADVAEFTPAVPAAFF